MLGRQGRTWFDSKGSWLAGASERRCYNLPLRSRPPAALRRNRSSLDAAYDGTLTCSALARPESSFERTQDVLASIRESGVLSRNCRGVSIDSHSKGSAKRSGSKRGGRGSKVQTHKQEKTPFRVWRRSHRVCAIGSRPQEYLDSSSILDCPAAFSLPYQPTKFLLIESQIVTVVTIIRPCLYSTGNRQLLNDVKAFSCHDR